MALIYLYMLLACLNHHYKNRVDLAKTRIIDYTNLFIISLINLIYIYIFFFKK
jgi:hypothetical protein